MSVRVKPAARADLVAIKAWRLSQWGQARTRDFLEGLIETIEAVQHYPQKGRPRDALLPGARSVRYTGHLILYVIDGAGPVVVAVLNERRNLAALSFANRVADGGSP